MAVTKFVYHKIFSQHKLLLYTTTHIFDIFDKMLNEYLCLSTQAYTVSKMH